jgi:hypothetical protein
MGGRAKLCPLNILPHGEDRHQHVKDVDKMVLTDPSETRTKESNVYASVKVANLWTRNESEGSFGGLRKDPLAGALPTEPDVLLKVLSMSVSVGTRKMVNYA